MSKNRVEVLCPMALSCGLTFWGSLDVHVGKKAGLHLNDKGLRVKFVGTHIEYYSEMVQDDEGCEHEEIRTRITRLFKQKAQIALAGPFIGPGRHRFRFQFVVPDGLEDSRMGGTGDGDEHFVYHIEAALGRSGMTNFELSQKHVVNISPGNEVEMLRVGAIVLENFGPCNVDPPENSPQLTIDVIEGRALPKADRFGKSDPYVTLTLVKSDGWNVTHGEMKSAVIKKTLDPSWNESFNVVENLVDSGDLLGFQELRVQVWDWDRVGSSDIIGEATLTLGQEINDGDTFEGWVALNTKGDINLRVMYQSGTDPELDEKSQPEEVQEVIAPPDEDKEEDEDEDEEEEEAEAEAEVEAEAEAEAEPEAEAEAEAEAEPEASFRDGASPPGSI